MTIDELFAKLTAVKANVPNCGPCEVLWESGGEYAIINSAEMEDVELDPEAVDDYDENDPASYTAGCLVLRNTQ